MTEREMEDLIAAYPNELIPGHDLTLKGRQESFAGVGRFDLLFVDRFKTNVLMELKARSAKYEDATKLAKYKDVLGQTGDRIIMWLVAPLIPRPVREFLDHIGIQYTEIHEIEFRMAADRHGVTLENRKADQFAMKPSSDVLKEPHAPKAAQPLESAIRDGRSSKAMMDECLALLKQIDPSISLNLSTRKAQDGSFIGLLIGTQPHNFILFTPRKTMPLGVRVFVATERANGWRERLKAADIKLISVKESKRERNPKREQRIVRFSLPKEKFDGNLLTDLFRESYENYEHKSR